MPAPSFVQPTDQNYEVTPQELFFDLVFAFAVSQLSHHLLSHLSWRGIVETLVMLRAVYGVWYATSWVATMIPTNQSRTRWMLLTVMLLGLFMNAAVTWAFTTSGWAFIIPLLLIQLGRTIWTIANETNPVFRDHFSRAFIWFIAISPLWVAGAAANPEIRLLWWVLAALIDQVGAWLAHPLPGRWLQTENVDFAGGHMLERCRLFLLIALGETILTTGAAITATSLTLMTVITGTAALAGTIALWSLAFGRGGHRIFRYVEGTRDPARTSHHAVSSLLVIVEGLIALAVANEQVIANPYEGISTILSVLLYGGPILFLFAVSWYLRAALWVRPRLHWIGIAVLFVVGFATMTVPRYVALILVGIILAVMAIVDLNHIYTARSKN